jgi:hypothetical protein
MSYKKMTITLDCGLYVEVDALYFQHTYLSLLEGRPNREMNDDLIKEATNEMSHLWGDRQTYVVPPAIDESNLQHLVLPPVRFTVWLTCYEPIHTDNAGSE